MKTTTTPVAITCFGKLPSQGDFVRAGRDHRLIAMLDQWAGRGLEMLSRDMDWKLVHDAAPTLHFAFVGSRKRVAVAGHFMPSRDASGRRFPFMVAGNVDVDRPPAFMARAPLALSRLWTLTARHGAAVMGAHAQDATDALCRLSDTTIDVAVDAVAHDASHEDFLAIETVGSLQVMLEQAGHDVSVRGILLGLGDLMEPVMASGATRLHRGLVLPLPAAGARQHAVAAFWSELLAGFLGRSGHELLLLIDNGPTPRLSIGFSGGHERTLCSVLDPRLREEYNIVLDKPDWVGEVIAEDYSLKKLASYLDHESLSLRTARDTFMETFLGR